MERTASIALLVKTLLFMSALLYLCAINIFVVIRYRRSFPVTVFHISSLFGFCGIFCLMMDAIILDLPIENTFVTASQISFALCVLCVVTGAAELVRRKRKEAVYLGLPADLEAVFASASDLALVADYKGVIAHVNQPEKLRMICQKPKTLMEIIAQLKEKHIGIWPFPKDIDALSDSMQCEVVFREREEYYLFKISPIISGAVKVGFTVLFEDISAIRQSEARLKDQNKDLAEANEKLSHYVKIAGALEAQNERLEILSQLQATLVQKIERAIRSVRHIQNSSFEEPTHRRDIKEVAALLRSVYKDVRASVSRIAGKDV